MNRIRLAIHRLFRRPVSTGPVRLYTRRVPDGIFLDLEEYFTRVITTLADDPDALDLLMQIAEDRGQARGHDGWEPEELLVERLADLIGYEVPVRGKQLAALADRLGAAVLRPRLVIPAQREAGAA
jgi:hypothetical protein